MGVNAGDKVLIPQVRRARIPSGVFRGVATPAATVFGIGTGALLTSIVSCLLMLDFY